MHLACGLSVGLTGLAAGYAIGVVGDTVWLFRYDTLARELMWMIAVGRAGIHAAVADLRGDGVDIDLCRGAGFIRV